MYCTSGIDVGDRLKFPSEDSLGHCLPPEALQQCGLPRQLASLNATIY